SSLAFSPTAAPTPATYTLSLHDALPICEDRLGQVLVGIDVQGQETRGGDQIPRGGARIDEADALAGVVFDAGDVVTVDAGEAVRSEEHTSELQSRENLVCRLLLEKKKQD